MPSLPLPPAMAAASASLAASVAAKSPLMAANENAASFRDLPVADQALLLPLSRLPYLVSLKPTPDLLCRFLEEHKKDLAVKSARQLYDARRKIDRAKFLGETEETRMAWNALDAAVAEKNAVTEKLDRVLHKHYRTRSLQLHPDKCGEDKRPAFEALTAARDVLRDAEMRCNYMEEMMSVAGRPDLACIPGLVQRGHDAWVKKYVPGAAPPPPTAKSPKKEKPLQLTGGLVNDMPRKPRIYIQNLNDRLIRVAMPPPTDSSEVGSWATYQFYNYCTRVTVLADDKEVATVEGEELQKFAKAGASEITVDLVLPQARRYDIRWYATLRMGEESPEQSTPCSSESTADLTSPAALRRRAEIGAVNELCLRRAGELRSCLSSLRQNGGAGTKEAEVRHWKLHGAMARGRGAEHRLVSLLKDDGQLNKKGEGTNLPAGLAVIREALAEALPLQKELKDEADRAGKRTALKKFKNHVAGTIERGEAEEWLADVTEDELRELGGEPNRLYQLLVEGRGAKLRFDSLVLDSSALTAAAARDDLFTAKQCDALQERAAEAERLAAEEAEKAAKEAKAKKEEERERHEAQLRGIAEKKAREAEMKALNAVLKQSRMATGAGSSQQETLDPGLVQGAVVLLHSLVKAAMLNGSTATLEQLPDGGKCVVRCHADGVLRKVPTKNIRIWNGEEAAPAPAPAPSPAPACRGGWSCSSCTFHHEGAMSTATKCQMCDSQRRPREGSWTGVATSKLSEGHQGQAQQQQQAPKQATATHSNTKQATTKQRAATIPPSPPQRAKGKKQTQQQLQQQNPKSPQRQHHQKLRCRDGASCRFLRQGPDVCHFRHTPEEIAAAAKYAKANAWIERTLRISPAVVGWVIGKGGIHIREVMEGSGAKVWIDQESMGPEEMRIVNIKGKKNCVETAVEMVKDLAYNAPYVGGPHTVEDDEDDKGDVRVAATGAAEATDNVAQQKPAPPAPAMKPPSTKSSPSNPLQRQAIPPQCQPTRAEPVSPELPSPAQTPAPVPKPEPELVPVPPVRAPDPTPSQPILQDNSEAILKPPEPEDMGTPLQLSPSYDGVGEIAPPMRPDPAVVSPAQGLTPLPNLGLNVSHVEPKQGTNGTSALLTFLQLQKACLKGSPSDFHTWLSQSEDIATIEDLSEAVKDDGYLREVLQPGDGSVGVKGFKRAAFKKSVLAAAEEAGGNDETEGENGVNIDIRCTGSVGGSAAPAPAVGFPFGAAANSSCVGRPADIPTELVCPITHVLMTQDPVLAADGMTYERAAIEMWFERQKSEVEAAQCELRVDSTSQRAKSIVERGVLSPVTHTKMPSLSLIPNVALRTMARDVSRSSQSLY